MAQEVVRLTNIERSKAGLPDLVLDSSLTSSARSHSAYMFENNVFEHTTVYSVAENIYKKASTTAPTAATIVAAWMASAGHKANILNPEYKKIGVGIVKGMLYSTNLGKEMPTYFATQHFTR
jgi:uncharacterized protein YkwD